MATTAVLATRTEREETEAELVARAKAGDEAAIKKLYNDNKGRVYRVCFGVTGNHHDAEDLTQEVFIRVFAKRKIEGFNGGFNGCCRFSTWLHKIARNQGLDYLDKKRVRGFVVAFDDVEETKAGADAKHFATTDRDLEETPDLEPLHKLIEIAEFSATTSSILALRYGEGCEISEIARRLGMNESTVKIRLYRARRKLIKLNKKLRGPSASK